MTIWMLLLQCIYSLSVSDFQGKSFKFTNKPSGIYEVSVGLDEFRGLMSAYGDFNGDKSVDVVTISDDQLDISILYWGSNGFTPIRICSEICTNEDSPIVGVIPGDYDYDGLLDLLVVLQPNEDSYNLNFFIQESQHKNGYPSFYKSPNNPDSQSYPFVADFAGNHHTSVMIMTDGGRQIFDLNNTQSIPFADFVSTSASCLNPTDSMTTPLTTPHFSAVVDVSSDCRADLMITSTAGVEYWYTEQPSSGAILGRYCLKKIYKHDGLNLLAVSYVDVNFDGAIDMVSTVSNTDNNQYIIINYNTYDNPVSPPNLCQVNTKLENRGLTLPFNDIELLNGEYTYFTQLLVDGIQYTLYNYEAIKLQSVLAPSLRFGDYLASGYPGAMTTLTHTTSTIPSTYYIDNYSCSSQVNCDRLKVKNPRYLQINTNPGSDFTLITKPASINAAFFDYGENGRLDMLINAIVGDSYTIFAYYNYISLDAFYLKALGLDGQCAANDEADITCLGALYYGSTYMFRVTDIDGQYNPAVGVQLYQSAYTPLQLPYAYMGLGRTNNYIENFYMGIPLIDGAVKQWTPIIPNSQLIVSPKSTSTSNWTLSIFIEPTEAILIVVIVTVIILLILGGIIVWKHIKEKEEDKKIQEPFFQMFR